ncbi:MAG: RNA polymerase sigma factor [Crocinitomicaceae bacterium]
MLLNLLNRRNLRQLSDQDLVVSYAKSASKLIIGEIFKRYGKMMYGVNLKYLKNTQDAEDVLIQSFEALPLKMAKSDIKNLKNWLYTVTKNECLQFIRKRKPNDSIDNTLLLKQNSENEDLEAVFTKEEKLTVLEKAILLLKSEQKVCIELFYLKRFCYEEVADKTGFEVKKVKSYIQNGKRNLKLILEEKDVFKS